MDDLPTMLCDNVLVQIDERAEKTHNGFFIPVKSVLDHDKGTVVAVGEGTVNKKGILLPLDVMVNDRIVLPVNIGQPIVMNSITYRLIKETDILFIITDEEV